MPTPTLSSEFINLLLGFDINPTPNCLFCGIYICKRCSDRKFCKNCQNRIPTLLRIIYHLFTYLILISVIMSIVSIFVEKLKFILFLGIFLLIRILHALIYSEVESKYNNFGKKESKMQKNTIQDQKKEEAKKLCPICKKIVPKETEICPICNHLFDF